ncbi:hypothetical protein CspeluHIS016_0306900 [Cutaneotrichosporon spelunceum]|uniref:Uncharacterized protein n=1 Tax=Cutaneotrichosporon spelunceum TaxID=1672016 RepID=A0AAD3TTX4_9TREE|nr:hypothetical protein CspeluHIS016_0306900 [Cutaneotrichosporon spelunceum]
MPPTPVTVSVRPAHAGAPKSRFGTFPTVTLTPRAPSAPKPKPASAPLTANQKRKLVAATPMPTEELLSRTMVAQNSSIVDRCLARALPPSPPLKLGKRNSHQHTPAASPAPTGPVNPNPYSPAIDLANNRSSVPSPQELARAERAEEEKARQKKENAAAARAAAALMRRRKALRSGRNSRTPSASVTPATMIPPIQRAVGRERARSAEAAAAAARLAEDGSLVTVELEDGISGLTSRSLKRTRSSGPRTLTPGGAASVSINSPLRTVTAADEHTSAAEEEVPRKRSRLVDTPRRGNSSPTGSEASLHDSGVRKSPRVSASLSPVEPTSAAMRRVVSATERSSTRTTRGNSGAPRNASVGPESTRERSRRDTQPPSHMRDFTIS